MVTASRHDEPAFKSARAVTGITRADLLERASRTTPEALFDEAGVFVQRTNYGGGAPIIRGQLGNRVLLLVDGIRLNNATFRSGPNQYLNTVDPLVLERLEVVRGPGAAVYGSDAIGGLINVLTIQPRYDGSGWGGEARAASTTMDRGAQVGVRVGYSGEHVGSVATASFRHFGDLWGVRGPQPFTGYDEWSASATVGWQPSAGHRLVGSFQTSNQLDVPRAFGSTPLDFRVFNAQERHLGYLRYTVTGVGPFSELRATASANRQREVLTRYRVARDSRSVDEVADTVYGLQLEGEFQAGGPLLLGVEAFLDDLFTQTSLGPLAGGTLRPDAATARYPGGTGYFSSAVFAHHTLRFAPAWALTTEARLGLVRITAPSDDRLALLFPPANLPPLPRLDEVGAVYAGGLHLRYEPAPWAALNLGAMLGFRAPNVDDYARLGSEGTGFQVPGRGLRPERAVSGELGLKLRAEWAELDLTYAYTYIADAMARQVSSLADGTITQLEGQRILASANVESAQFHSVEAAARVPVWRRLMVFGTFAYTHGEQATLDPLTLDRRAEPTSKTPPGFGTVGVGWHAPARHWFVEGLVRFALDQPRLSEVDRGDTRICPDVPGRCLGTPGWVTLSVRASVRLFEHLRLTLVLENLTNRDYRMHASGLQGAAFGASGLVQGEL